jgi:thymidine kinase
MMSGKTSAMLALIDRFKHQKKSVVCFKPKMDDRYSVDEVVTHSGLKLAAVAIETPVELLGHLDSLDSMPDVVALDEAFMVKGAAKLLVWLFRKGVTVMVSSLNLSANCTPFDEVRYILPWATEVVKCTAVCVVCGADAHYTYKKSSQTDVVAVGGSEMYEPRCGLCHPKFKSND